MDLNQYQLRALKSLAITTKDVRALAHRSLGLTGEAGETANVIKKIIRDRSGTPTDDDIQLIAEKLGDTLYYIAAVSEFFALDLDEIASMNLKKSEAFRKARDL